MPETFKFMRIQAILSLYYAVTLLVETVFTLLKLQ